MSVSRVGDWNRLGLSALDLENLVTWLPGMPVSGVTTEPISQKNWHGTDIGYMGRISFDETGKALVIVSGPLSATVPEHAASSFGVFLGNMIAQAYAQATIDKNVAQDKSQVEHWLSLISAVLGARFSNPQQDWRESLSYALAGTHGKDVDTAERAVEVMTNHFNVMDQAADPNLFLRGYQTQLAEIDLKVRRTCLRNTLQDRLSDPVLRTLSLRVLDSGLKPSVSGEDVEAKEQDIVLRSAQDLARALSKATKPYSHSASIRQVGESAQSLDRFWRAVPTDERRAYKPGLIRTLYSDSGARAC